MLYNGNDEGHPAGFSHGAAHIDLRLASLSLDKTGIKKQREMISSGQVYVD